jgi:hypothetical protein
MIAYCLYAPGRFTAMVPTSSEADNVLSLSTSIVGMLRSESLVDILKNRYGFTPPISSALYKQGYRSLSMTDWNMCLGIVGCPHDDVRPAFAGAIYDFLTTAMQKLDISIKKFPSFLFDLDKSNPSHLAPIERGQIVTFSSEEEIQHTYDSRATLVTEKVSPMLSSSYIQLPSSDDSRSLWLTT